MDGLLPQENVLCILRFEASISRPRDAEDGGRGEGKICETSQLAVLPPGAGGTTASRPQASDVVQEGATAVAQRYYRQVPGPGSTAGGTGPVPEEARKPSV